MSTSVYLITGASRGLGEAIARQLHTSGENVVGVVRGKGQWPFDTLRADLLSENAPDSIIRYLKEQEFILKGWVHAAGILHKMEVGQWDEALANEMWRLHVAFPMAFMSHSLPYWEKGGHLVQLSSMSGYSGSSRFQGMSVYGATKAAQAALVESWAEELKDWEISANALALGAVRTDMLLQAFPGYTGGVCVEEMAVWITSFLKTGHKVMNGKILPLALEVP